MITGQDILAVEEALRPFDGEAFVRARIGRLYYAIFLESRAFCETHFGYARQKMSREHQAIVNMLHTVDPAFSDALSVLRRARNQADYDDHLPSSEIADLAEEALLLSTFLMSRLEHLRDDKH